MAPTILTRFREITSLTTSQYSDADVTANAEPQALSRYNHIMQTTETITAHTTSDALIDDIIAYLVSEYAENYLYQRRLKSDLKIVIYYEQTALRLMYNIDSKMVGYNPNTFMYYSRHVKSGAPSTSVGIGRLS